MKLRIISNILDALDIIFIDLTGVLDQQQTKISDYYSAALDCVEEYWTNNSSIEGARQPLITTQAVWDSVKDGLSEMGDCLLEIGGDLQGYGSDESDS